MPNRPILQQVPCYATRTSGRTHEIIMNNLQESPVYAGLIEGVGPRYCPSIEDKVVRFKDKESHLLFIEPEGRNTNEIYLQGCSTGFPIHLQWEIVRSIPGLENAEIVRPAYAVEYDFLNPVQFKHTLESKVLSGFYAAGQLLGTSGYEEAASQGLMAGINAALRVLNKDEFVLPRSESYIGTLLDDLVIKEITEPYRMMTSRSEHRLYLRQDNADRRLTPLGRKIGLVNDSRWKVFEQKMESFNSTMKTISETRLKSVPEINRQLKEIGQAEIGEFSSLTLKELLSRPKVDFALMERLSGLKFDVQTPKFEIETEVKYAGYVQRQDNSVEKMNAFEDKKIPEWIDYSQINHLSSEAKEKLSRIKPSTIGQASRIDGVRPSDLSVLLITMNS